VTDGRVYVEGPEGPVAVGALSEIVAAVGGPAWEITYSDWERKRYRNLDTGDEGLVVDVGDVVRAMEHDAGFARALAACPAETEGDDLSPRAGLFVGRLLDQLQSGLG